MNNIIQNENPFYKKYQNITKKNNRIIGNEEASMFIYNKIDSRTKEGIK